MFLRKLYSSESLAKNVDVIGDIPDTRGLYSSFMKIAWPAILESLLISLVGFVDSIMVSSCGTGAVASVGLTMQPRMLFYAVFFSLSVSVTAIVSRRKGQNDRDGANACLSQALTICILLVIVLGVVSFFVAEPLLYLAGAKEETIGNAVIYFRITMIGMLFTAFGLVINSAQRGSGNTKVSLRTNIVANVTNIVFNYLLINGVLFFPQLGVTGAAIATLLGNVASCAMSVYSLVPKDKFLDIRKLRLFRFDKAIIKTIGGISAGAGVEQVFMRFGFFVFSMIIANLGTPEIATHTICMNVQNLSFSAGDGLSVAASALIGQYIGKKRPDLATLYSKAGQRVGMVMSLVLIVALVFFGDSILLMFVDSADVNFDYVTNVGRNVLYIIAALSPAQISLVIFNGSLRGAGDTKYVAIVSAVSIVFFRTIISYLLCYPAGLGLYGAWISVGVDQYIRFALSARRFKSGKWALINI